MASAARRAFFLLMLAAVVVEVVVVCTGTWQKRRLAVAARPEAAGPSLKASATAACCRCCALRREELPLLSGHAGEGRVPRLPRLLLLLGARRRCSLCAMMMGRGGRGRGEPEEGGDERPRMREVVWTGLIAADDGRALTAAAGSVFFWSSPISSSSP